MSGGVLHVRGDAGERAGDRLRRGLILIEGRAGAYAGSRMIAGTLAIGGEAGELPGYLMGRGTILLGAGRDASLADLRRLRRARSGRGAASGRLCRSSQREASATVPPAAAAPRRRSGRARQGRDLASARLSERCGALALTSASAILGLSAGADDLLEGNWHDRRRPVAGAGPAWSAADRAPLLRWLIFTGATVFAAILLWRYGLIRLMVVSDRTYLSSVIGLIYVGASLHCLWRTIVDLARRRRWTAGCDPHRDGRRRCRRARPFGRAPRWPHRRPYPRSWPEGAHARARPARSDAAAPLAR